MRGAWVQTGPLGVHGGNNEEIDCALGWVASNGGSRGWLSGGRTHPSQRGAKGREELLVCAVERFTVKARGRSRSARAAGGEAAGGEAGQRAPREEKQVGAPRARVPRGRRPRGLRLPRRGLLALRFRFRFASAPAVRANGHGVLHRAEGGPGLRACVGRVTSAAQGLPAPWKATGASPGARR